MKKDIILHCQTVTALSSSNIGVAWINNPIHCHALYCLCLNTCDVNKQLCLGLKCQVSSTVSEPKHNARLSAEIYEHSRETLKVPLWHYPPFVFIWVISGLILPVSPHHYCWLNMCPVRIKCHVTPTNPIPGELIPGIINATVTSI